MILCLLCGTTILRSEKLSLNENRQLAEEID